LNLSPLVRATEQLEDLAALARIAAHASRA